MKDLVIFISICLLICSCSKNNIEQINNLGTTDSDITPTIIDGTLSFKTGDDLIKTIKFLSKLSVTEKKNWEEKNGFYSIRRRVEEGYEAIHKANIAESVDELKSVLKQYADVIELRDSVYEQIYPSTFYQTICDQNGLFITSNFIQKINQNKVQLYKIEDLDQLRLGVEIKPISSFALSTSSKGNNDPFILTAEYFDNPSGCKHDRRVYVNAKLYNLWCSWTHSDPLFDYMEGSAFVEINVWGTERNWLCNWSYYETQLAYRNVSFSLYAYQNDEACTFLDDALYSHATSSTIVPIMNINYPDYTSPGDMLKLSIDESFGHRILNEGLIYQEYQDNYKYFITCHAEGSSRGVILGFNWAVIDY